MDERKKKILSFLIDNELEPIKNIIKEKASLYHPKERINYVISSENINSYMHETDEYDCLYCDDCIVNGLENTRRDIEVEKKKKLKEAKNALYKMYKNNEISEKELTLDVRLHEDYYKEKEYGYLTYISSHNEYDRFVLCDICSEVFNHIILINNEVINSMRGYEWYELREYYMLNEIFESITYIDDLSELESVLELTKEVKKKLFQKF